MCCPPAVSLGQIHPQQSWWNWWNCINNLLDFICSELLACHVLCSVPASAEPRWLGTHFCSSQPVSAWSCCCKSLCAAGAEPLLHRESPCLCRESRMWGKACGRQQQQQIWEGKWGGVENERKRKTEKIYLLSVLNMFWGWQWWIIMSVSHPPAWGQADKQDQVLCSKCRGNTPQWGNGGDEDWWRLCLSQQFVLETSGNLLLHVRYSWLQSQSPFPASSSPSTVSSLGPCHTAWGRRNPAPPYCMPEQGC